MVVWLVLGRGPTIVGCAVVGVVAVDDSTEGVRLGLIESLGGRKDDVGGVDGGGVDAADEEEEGLEALVEGRRWRRGMGSFWEGHVVGRPAWVFILWLWIWASLGTASSTPADCRTRCASSAAGSSLKESGSSPQTDSCLVWGWEESLVYPSTRLDVDSGTGDKEAPEDEDEEVMLNLRSL